MVKSMNVKTFDKLMAMDLSQKAKDIITTTDMSEIEFLFGGFDTAEEVEQFIAEEYEE